MEKYGFVYIWFDRKLKMYYIGSHWGNIDDGYICSSKKMWDNHKYRPEDFKRRIVAKIYTNRKDTFIEEQRYLDMIKPGEIKARYYNVNLNAKEHWSANETTKKIVIEKITTNTKIAMQNPKTKEKLRKIALENNYTPPSRKGCVPWNKGIKTGPQSKEAREKKRKWMKENPNSGNFRIGYVPWNKGKKTGISWNKGLTAKTDSRVAEYGIKGAIKRKGLPSKAKGQTKETNPNRSKSGVKKGNIPWNKGNKKG